MVSCKRGHVFLHHAAAYIVARGLVFTVVTGAVFSNGASGAISLRIFLTSKTVRTPGVRTAPRHSPSRMGADGLHECLLPELKPFDLIPNSSCCQLLPLIQPIKPGYDDQSLRH